MRKSAMAAGLLVASVGAGCKVSVSVGAEDKLGTFMCTDIKDGACEGATERFAATAPVLHLYYRTKDVPKQGDAYDIAWIAEDVGDAAPPNTRIDAVKLEVKDSTAGGANYLVQSTLSKPTRGWPVGTYRVEVKRGDKLETTARFAIQ